MGDTMGTQWGRFFCVANRIIVPYNTNMARKPGQESGTGVYRVMMRGINRQNIFEEKSDCARFLETPAECSTKGPSPCAIPQDPSETVLCLTLVNEGVF
jgi:hypothetical protein